MPFDETLVDQGSFFYWVPEGETPPPVGDGVSYSRALGWQSPEGNFYGQERWVRDWHSAVIWTGLDYEILEVDGHVDDPEYLPIPGGINPRTGEVYEARVPFEIWTTPRPNWPPEGKEIYDGRALDYYWWDGEAQAWKLTEWFFLCEGEEALPRPGIRLGACHVIVYYDIKVMWNGYYWKRYSMEMIEGSERIDELEAATSGFVTGFNPDIELVYISASELAILPVSSDFDFIRIDGQVIDTSKRSSVFSFSPTLYWWEESGSFSLSSLQHSTEEEPQEYWVYLAGKSDSFKDDIPGGVYDFRGKLFCSKTTPSNNRMGALGSLAYGAILIGSCQTSVPENVGDKVTFLNEIGNSLVSRAADLRETFREFSDFDLTFTDETTLTLERIYNTTGQISIAGSLYYIGENRVLSNTDTRIAIDGNGIITFEYGTEITPETEITPISTSSTYYCYIAGDSDLYNANDLNPDTNRPWHPEDDGAGDGIEGPYYAAMDLRLKIFLSSKVPEDGRLSETYTGYWARHIGQVQVDAVGAFVFSSNISAIRQATLNPTFFDGLAEAALVYSPDPVVNRMQFTITKARGTSGIVMVGGQGVSLYSASDPLVHIVARTDKVYTYTGNFSDPLSWNGSSYIHQYTSQLLYIYLANNNPCWGELQGRTFTSTQSPVESEAYLSQSFPGNTARWIATLDVDSSGYFTGSYIVDAIKQILITIDDNATSQSTVWSSYKTHNAIVPPGTIIDFAGPSVPTGFLLCNGGWYSPSSYSALFAAIGGYWGWNGSQFAVPNLIHRATIGYGQNGVGTLLGEQNHTLSVNEIASHDHGTHSHWHNHGGYTGYNYFGYDSTETVYDNLWYPINTGGVIQGAVAFEGQVISYQIGRHGHGIGADATGSGVPTNGGSGAHNNMQPSAVVLKIIRY